MKTKNIIINIPEGYDDVRFNEKTNEIEFIKKDGKPRSWEEYRKQAKNIHRYGAKIADQNGSTYPIESVNIYVNEFNTEEEAKAIIALCKLIQLRDAWWGKWRPDWNDGSVTKYGIGTEYNKIDTEQWYNYNRMLVFPTSEMRNDFLKTFRDLIEEAKILL